MSKVFSKLKRTFITELVNSVNQRTIASVEIEDGGENYAVDDIFQIAGGTILKVITVDGGASNAVSNVSVASGGTYTNFIALSNVAVYDVNEVVADTYGGQPTVSGEGFTINVALDTNAVNTNRFYLLASGTPEAESISAEKESEYDGNLLVWDQTLFGKKADLIPMARRVTWEANTFYSAYDDKDELLSSKNFFVIDTVSREIYKCIDNGATVTNPFPESTVNPSVGEPQLGTPVRLGADGYTWLYMGTLEEETDVIFGTPSYFPVEEFANTKNAAINGGLFSIRVEDIGDNYITDNGTIFVDEGNSSNTNRVRLNKVLLNPSYYTNCGIKIANTSGGVEVKPINAIQTINLGATQYSEVSLKGTENFTAGFLQNGQSYLISPFVEINSYSGTNAAAYSIVANNGSIERIEMANEGSGYKDATAVIRAAPGIGTGATLRPIISPGNGHGSNIFDELYVDSVGISCKFDNEFFTREAKYSTLALLKNPTYANSSPYSNNSFDQVIKIPLGTPTSGNFEVGELVTGSNLNANTSRYPSAYVAYANSSLLMVTGAKGMFVHSSTITGQESNKSVFTANLLNWDTYFDTLPSNTAVGSNDYDVKLYSGDILYIKNTQSITRSVDSDEQIKIVIKL
jgi:hypothetical protein